MAIEEKDIGKPFRQYSGGLRVQRGAGYPDLVSERPFRLNRDGNKIYLDSDEKPTIITFDEHCQVDIPFLLQVGAIVPYELVSPETEKEAVKARRSDG